MNPTDADSISATPVTGVRIALPTGKPGGWRRPWIMIGGLVLMFVLGGAAGASLQLLWLERHIRWIKSHPDDFPDVAAAHISSKLGLSEGKQLELRDVIARNNAEMRKLRADFSPKFEARLDQIEQDVRAILTPEQYEKWLAEFRFVRQFFVYP